MMPKSHPSVVIFLASYYRRALLRLACSIWELRDKCLLL